MSAAQSQSLIEPIVQQQLKPIEKLPAYKIQSKDSQSPTKNDSFKPDKPDKQKALTTV